MSSNTDNERLVSRAFIGIHDKTPDMRILYVTSSIRDTLGFEPSEAVGQTALWFIENGNGEEYRTHISRHTTSEESVLVTKVYVRTVWGVPVYTKLLNFSCDNLAFNVCFVYSADMAPARVERSPLTVELVHGQAEQLASRRHSLLTAHQANARSQGRGRGGGGLVRACMMLEPISAGAAVMGPRILFASNSFDRIVNMDACDVQGMPFLQLVAPADVARAGRFLDNIKTAATVVVDQLRLLVNPLQDCPQTVAVEIMAAGADTGAVMLC
ncbi:hypothetical protein GGI20_006037, partial [Coemansia sp. BCRC 34301]